jgi:SAM-dependent methyltransferase
MDSPKDYWTNLAQAVGQADTLGLAPVLHPNTPEWFNRALDSLQYRALRRAILLAGISPRARFLDVGCGTGRWIRRYRELGFAPIGVDATLGMLRIARARQTDAPLVTGLATDLPFPDAVFDAVSDITVVQHIPYELQPKALREMVRVLRTGGRLILFELIRGRGSHIFPRPPDDWIREVQSCGATLIGSFGQEFLFLDRLFVRLAHLISEKGNPHTDPDLGASHHPASREDSVVRRLYWLLRRVTLGLSTSAEPAVAKVFPISMATHAVFVFRKLP